MTTRLRSPGPRIRSAGPRGVLARLLALALAAGLCGVVVLGLGKVRLETSLDSFLPADDPQLQSYDALGRELGGEPIVVLVETDDAQVLTVDRMPALVRLEGELSAVAGVSSAYGAGTLLNQVAGRAQDLLAELLGRRDAEAEVARANALAAGADDAAAQAAADEAYAVFDARYGPLLVEGMAGGIPTLSNQDFIDTVTLGSAGNPRLAWRFLLPTRQAAAVLVRPVAGLDAARTAALVRDVRAVVEASAPEGAEVTVTGTPVMVTALSDTATADAPRLGVLAVAAVALCFALARWLPRGRRWLPLATTAVAVTVTVALLGWWGRPVSLGTVAFSSVLLGIGCYYPTYALTRARLRTVVTVGLATAASLATLVLSPMPLVQDVGVTLGLGVLVCLLLALVLRRLLARRPGGLGPSDGEALRSTTTEPAAPPAPLRRARVLLAGVGLVAVAGWVALPGLRVDADVEHFAGGVPELEDARHVEDVLGSSGEVTVVLRGTDVLSPEALAWQRQVVDQVARESGDVMRAAVSAPALLPFLDDTATAEQIDAAVRLMPEYLTRTVVTPDRRTAALTYGVRLDDVAGLAEVRRRLLADLPPPPSGYEVELTGLPLVLLQGSDLVSADRVVANVAGILVAAAVLAVGLRRRGDALRAAVAATVATGVGFALLALAGRGLDPVTVSLGALTAAIGCEFTVVGAEAVRRGSAQLRRAVVLVAATSAAGYLALLGSGLGVVRGFGAQLAVAVLLALLASRLVVDATVRPAAPADPRRADAADPTDRPTDPDPGRTDRSSSDRRQEAVHA